MYVSLSETVPPSIGAQCVSKYSLCWTQFCLGILSLALVQDRASKRPRRATVPHHLDINDSTPSSNRSGHGGRTRDSDSTPHSDKPTHSDSTTQSDRATHSDSATQSDRATHSDSTSDQEAAPVFTPRECEGAAHWLSCLEESLLGTPPVSPRLGHRGADVDSAGAQGTEREGGEREGAQGESLLGTPPVSPRHGHSGTALGGTEWEGEDTEREGATWQKEERKGIERGEAKKEAPAEASDGGGKRAHRPQSLSRRLCPGVALYLAQVSSHLPLR